MILGKYNQAKTITFDLFEVDGVDLSIAATFAAGDVKIMKDEGVEANTTNLPTDEGSSYSLVLTAAEMSAARIRIILIDQTATKVWLDTTLGLETYGNASAEHALDLDDAVRGGMTALPNAAADAAGGLPISDAGGLDIDTKLANTNEITAARMGALTDWINGGRLDLILDIIAADTTTDIPALIATAQADLDTITGADGAALASTQQSITFQPITITAGDAIPNVTFAGTGSEDGISFERAGSGDMYDAVIMAQLNAEMDTALTDYDAATGTELAATEAKIDIIDTNVDAVLVDTNDLQTNQGNWLTATGFATEAKQDAQDAIITDARLAELDAANLPADIAAVKADTAATLIDTASIGITKNATFSNLEFLMVDETDHITPETGLTVTGQMSIDGGAFASVNGSIAEVSNGIYQVDLTAADTNGDVITYRFSSTGAADRFITIKTRA